MCERYYKPKRRWLYGMGTEVQILVNPKQKWLYMQYNGGWIWLERRGTFIIIDEDSFKKTWEEW